MKWSNIPQAPEDTVFKVTRLFEECENPKKISLGVGAYRCADGQPLVLKAIAKAKEGLASLPSQLWMHEYQPISGHDGFLSAAQELVLGESLKSVKPRVVSMQTLGGTGACRLACEFLSRFGDDKTLLIPDHTWLNHHAIGHNAGLELQTYRYLDETDPAHPELDFEGLLEDLNVAPRGAAVLLHLCAHNPTGVDPTLHQWEQIADCCLRRNLQPLMDNAYQGFASGDLDRDAEPLHLFIKKGLCPTLACSFAKNMGLYGERVGALHVVAPDPASAQAALSQLKMIARAMYSNPPRFGATVAYRVMTEPDLRVMWEEELKEMSSRIANMRMALRTRLEAQVEKPRSWDHITNQIGMFSFTGLTPEQVEYCAEKGVYMLHTGRISMAGLNESNVDYAAEVMAEAINVLDHRNLRSKW